MFSALQRAFFPTGRNPQIPGRYDLQTVHCNISGSEYSMQVLPTNTGFANQDSNLERFDLYDASKYLTLGKEEYGSRRCGIGYVRSRTSTVHHGFMGGRQHGIISSLTSVINFPDLPESMNLFDPRHFMQAVEHFHYFACGPGAETFRDDGYHKGRWIKKDGIVWLNFERRDSEALEYLRASDGVEHDEMTVSGNRALYYAAPIGRAQMLTVMFRLSAWEPATAASKVFYEIAGQLYPTLQLRYGGEALKWQAEVPEAVREARPTLGPDWHIRKTPAEYDEIQHPSGKYEDVMRTPPEPLPEWRP